MSAALVRRAIAPAVLLSLVSVIWAASAVIARAVIYDIGPHSLNFGRWALALLLLLPFAWPHVRRQRRLIATHWRLLGACGLLSVSVYSATVYVAAHTTEALNIGVVGATTPIASAIASWLILRVGVSPREAIGFGVGLVGLLAVISQGDLTVLLGLAFRPGDLIMLLGVATWGVYSVLLRRIPPGLHSLSLLTAIIATGLVGIVPFFVWELVVQRTPLVFNFAAVFAVIFNAVLTSLLVYLFFAKGVAALGPNRANLYAFLAPPFTALFAFVFLGETLALYHIAGMALIFVGIYVATSRPARAGGAVA